MALHTQPYVGMYASDRELVKGFERLKKQALHWVFEGYPVGDYYEAALPERDAFCMRDVSHQCTGGQVLGLGRHNKNMFAKFAQSLSEKRDYCGYWEIDRWNRPCPVDYKDDTDFWYNFPANFDVLYACWRMYEWTGDRDYLAGDDFDRFFAYTMEQYIKRWDRDGDGIPDRIPEEGRRGIASYDESEFAYGNYRYGADMLAVLGRAHVAYAKMCRVLGRKEQAAIYQKRADALLKRLNGQWYDAQKGFAIAMGMDGRLIFAKETAAGQSLLYWDVVSDPAHAQKTLNAMEEYMEHVQIENLSHYPEIFWRYGREESAMKALRLLMDPACPRKEYPEASYCAIGAIVTGMMGVEPTVSAQETRDGRRVRTLSGLEDDLEWVEVRQIPVIDGMLHVRHEGKTRTIVGWEDGEPLVWRAAFHGRGMVEVEGRRIPTQTMRNPFTGADLTYADVCITPGEEKRAVFYQA